jgi:dihydrofolate synthase/folylpolyglutamate synthase
MTTTENAYNRALDYLYSFVDYSLKHASELAKADFDLERMRQLMAMLGNPQNAYPTIHVAGTKGKGSVSAMCASALQAAGYRTGLYTSPHLQDFTERIKVDNQPIPHLKLAVLLEEMKPAIARVEKLTTFEITTALAFLYFARQKVNAAVIEVGLGGRLDATNIITPRVSVITSLSYDHTAVLGETLTLIAGEKAGIIKPSIPVVSAPQKDEALRVLEKVAAERRSPLTLIGRDVTFSPDIYSLDGQTFRIHPQPKRVGTAPLNEKKSVVQNTAFKIPLLGAHQLENAVTAYAALKTSGLNASDEAIRQGFAKVHWLGRFEVARRENPTVIFDAAHNQDSFEKLAQTLETYFPGRKVTLIFGVSEDKHTSAMLTAIKPLLERLIATCARHPRALGPEKIVETARQVGVVCEVAASAETALDRAVENAQKDGSIVLSAGSIFVTAEVKQAFLKRTSFPPQMRKNG